MPNFKYKVIRPNGEIITDVFSASSKKEAEAYLLDQKLKLISLTEEKKGLGFTLFQNNKFPLREKILLCRYISLLISAGLPLGESFDLLISESKIPLVKRVLQDIALSINQGKSLLFAFGKYPKFFDDNFLAMVKTGETSGTLSKSFDYLSRQFKQQEELKQKVVSAMIYPVIIIALMFGIVSLMFTFVMPRLAKAFLKMNLDIPLATKIMLETSLWVEKNLLLVGISVVIIAFLFILAIMSSKGQKIFFSVIIKLPVIKDVFLQYNLARFTQSLSSLLQGGVPIIDSLEIASKALITPRKEQIAKMFRERVAQGLSLTVVFSEEKLFPTLMNQMIAIGERSGNLDKILVDLSIFYQEEVENSLKNFIAVLEPVLLIIIGVGVGLLVLSVISPIYSLIGKIQPT